MVFRNEHKYLITESELHILKSRLAYLMKPDPHAGPDGKYIISSLYFDDHFNRCYYENENGAGKREKFRIRIYDHDPGRISLECKKKEGTMTVKESCILTRAQCDDLIAGKAPEDMENQPVLLRRFGMLMRMYRFRPVVITEYERTAFIYRTGNVRITFDTNILAASGKTGRFLAGDDFKKPVLPKGIHLMEVKWDNIMPSQFLEAMQIRGIRRTSFSKFYSCRSLFMI